MRLLLLIAYLAVASSLFGHCPYAPTLPECPVTPAPPPTPVPPPTPTPTPTPTPVEPTPTPTPPPPPPEEHYTTQIISSVKELLIETTVGTATVSTPAFPIIFAGDGLAWTISNTTTDGVSWLSTNPRQGYDDVNLQAIAATANLKPGTYTGIISFISPGALNSPQKINVTLRVREPVPSTLRPSLAKVDFTAREDAPDPAVQKIAIRSEGETNPDWRVAAVTLNGGNWLAITPATGKGSGEITVTAKIKDLSAGVYAARITLTSDQAANKTLEIPVSFTVTRQKSSISTGGIVNAASLTPGSGVVPGGLYTIVGERLGPKTGVPGQLNATTGRFATNVGGTRVLFDNVAAPILFSSANQLNVQVPFEVAGKATVKVVIEAASFDPAETTVPVTDVAPGLFTVDGRRAAALHSDYSLNTPENPVAAGDVIQFFTTGQGLTTPRVETGALAPSVAPFAEANQGVAVFIGGRRAELLFAGMAPGALGLLQINAVVPVETTPGRDIAVGIRFGLTSLPEPGLIAVKPAP